MHLCVCALEPVLSDSRCGRATPSLALLYMTDIATASPSGHAGGTSVRLPPVLVVITRDAGGPSSFPGVSDKFETACVDHGSASWLVIAAAISAAH